MRMGDDENRDLVGQSVVRQIMIGQKSSNNNF
jgi:hypothetical protein